jgi:ribosomal 50S subunit-associated protein YjgA (DUF615 family)
MTNTLLACQKRAREMAAINSIRDAVVKLGEQAATHLPAVNDVDRDELTNQLDSAVDEVLAALSEAEAATVRRFQEATGPTASTQYSPSAVLAALLADGRRPDPRLL